MLEAEGIDCSALQYSALLPTGSAFIAVDDEGENSIIVHPGANADLRPEQVTLDLLAGADALLLQLECPLETVTMALKTAAQLGLRTVFNPSPLTPAFIESRCGADVMVVNEGEAMALTGMAVAELRLRALAAVALAGCSVLIVTRGAMSTLLLTAAGCSELLPPTVQPVDTVGAGDSFAGALTVELARGCSLQDAVRYANAAGALATLKAGAQPALPTRSCILAALG
jgi:ribokinase